MIVEFFFFYNFIIYHFIKFIYHKYISIFSLTITEDNFLFRLIFFFFFFKNLSIEKAKEQKKKKKNIPTLYFLYVRLQAEQDSLW